MKRNVTLESMSVFEVLNLWARCLQVLGRLGYNSNNPVGDHTEHLVAKALKLWLMDEEGYDAVDPEGWKYQIKGRCIRRRNGSRLVSDLRGLKRAQFDYLVVVLYHADMTVWKACVIPYHIVRRRAKYNHRKSKARKFYARDKIWSIRGVQDITAELSQVEKGA